MRALPEHWQEHFGYEPLLCETFTDIESHAGTCYKAAGWTALGLTEGNSRQRAEFYVYATDDEALDAFQEVSRMEGIVPAPETAHALAYVKKLAPAMSKDQIIVVSCSGRRDKDVVQAARIVFGEEFFG